MNHKPLGRSDNQILIIKGVTTDSIYRPELDTKSKLGNLKSDMLIMDKNKYTGDDFYCDQVLSGRTPIEVVMETQEVLAFYHTRPFWPVHIVVIPKLHVTSLVDLGVGGEEVLTQIMAVVRQVASQVLAEHGSCRVLTNLGEYQDSKHLHFHVCVGKPLRADS